MTYINPEDYERLYMKRRPYPRIKDYKSILSARVYNALDPEARAIDHLDAPINALTTLPYWLVWYLHQHRDTVVEQEVIYKEANRKGYESDHVKASLKWLTDTQANIGHWQDQKTKTRYLRWYEPTALTDQVQECLDRGDDW